MTQQVLQKHTIDLDSAQSSNWDVAIIGGGVGGSAAAYALAHKGYKVLLVEKGYASPSNTEPKGVEIETEDPEERLQAGRWPYKLTTQVDGSNAELWAPLGCGVGGSSLLFAAAMSRLEPLDFDEQSAPDGGKALSWPIDYQDIEPYYHQAEQLYSVCGTADPLTHQANLNLKTPPPMCEVDQHFFDVFENSALHPYRLHVGAKFLNQCDGCGGRICRTACKQDSMQSTILPALPTGNLTILDQTQVLSIEANSHTVTSLTVKRHDTIGNITANTYVLSAGGYFSPAVLLRSRNKHWPNGLGNTHDVVGRYLMFHVSEFIAIWPKGKFAAKGARNTIALRDFYHFNGQKYGELQSTGMGAGYGNILYYLRTVVDQSWLRYIPLLRQFLRIPAYIGAKLFSDATVFAGILEDFPYFSNRVVIDDQTDSGIRVEYTIHDELKSRTKAFRKLLKKTVKSNFMFPMTESIWLNYGHPCGTCSAGTDPTTSVVDKNCKVHEIDNLYIADSSIMPTSGATNPSLTIAANALRVADAIDNRIRSTEQLVTTAKKNTGSTS